MYLYRTTTLFSSLCSVGLRSFAASSSWSGSKEVIYWSPHPARQTLPRTSLYAHLFQSGRNSSLGDSLPVFVDASDGRTLTRGDLKQLAGRLATGLRRRAGQDSEGEGTVGLFMSNSIEWPVAFLGAQKGGYRTALYASSLTPFDLAHQLDLSSPRITFTTPSLLPILLEASSLRNQSLSGKAALEQTVVVSSAGEEDSSGCLTWEDMLAEEAEETPVSWNEGDEHQTSVICFSSGTEGMSKGVETTHHNLTSLMEMMRPPIYPALNAGKDSILGILPFPHIYGLFKLILLPLQHGFSVVVLPKIDLRTICQAIETYKITSAILVPPILIHFAQSKLIDKYDMSSLKWLLSGAAPLGKDLVAAVEDRFKEQDLVLLQGSGLTETSPVTHILQLEDARSHPGSVGRLIPNTEARLIDDDGRDATSTEGVWPEGEMWFRGPNVMKGYLNNPTSTAATFAPSTDGGAPWLKTGDIATVDPDGYFYIIDRRKELIKYNGYQVAPAELEALLLTHPMVADVGVIGVMSKEEQVEVPRAYVVPKPDLLEPGQEAQFAQDVTMWLQQRVASHKYLRGGVHLVEQIPKSASGKILRRKLRDLSKGD